MTWLRKLLSIVVVCVTHMPVPSLHAAANSKVSARGPASSSLSSYTALQIQALALPQIAALTKAQVVALTPVQVAALTPAQVAAFTPAQVAAFTPAQVATFTSAQIAVLTPVQVAAFTAAQVAALTTVQLAAISTALASLGTTSEASGSGVPATVTRTMVMASYLVHASNDGPGVSVLPSASGGGTGAFNGNSVANDVAIIAEGPLPGTLVIRGSTTSGGLSVGEFGTMALTLSLANLGLGTSGNTLSGTVVAVAIGDSTFYGILNLN